MHNIGPLICHYYRDYEDFNHSEDNLFYLILLDRYLNLIYTDSYYILDT